MTRKKWNRLRRQRPELFKFLQPWETMSPSELAVMRPVSKSRVIAVMTAFVLRYGPRGLSHPT
jgi:hypothetical protein